MQLLETLIQRARDFDLGFERQVFSPDDPTGFIEKHNRDRHADMMKALGYSD